MKLGMGSAFPNTYYGVDSIGEERVQDQESGLTKRELFAAMAMQGLLWNSRDQVSNDQLAAEAVEQADALLAALEPAPVGYGGAE